VYLFEDAAGRVLHVGRAGDLRARVRAHFAADDRRSRRLVRETARIDHLVCRHPLEAAVVEARLVAASQPVLSGPRGRRPAPAYVKLTAAVGAGGHPPRLLVVHRPRPDGALYLGPFPSTRAARLVRQAIQTAGGELLRRAVAGEPGLLLGPLATRMDRLAAARRFAEAVDARQQYQALAEALRRQRLLDTVRAAGRVEVESGGVRLVIEGGRLVTPGLPGPAGPPPPPPAPVSPADAAEMMIVACWLEQEGAAGRLRLLHGDGPLDALWPAAPAAA
jgi:DNA polymerase-3 subunit epsilon